MTKPQASINGDSIASEPLDALSVLSSVWILASNDETNIITYRSLRRRLGLAADYPIERHIEARGDLFRPSVPVAHLEAWKENMRQGRQLPSWVRDEKDEAARLRLINSLQPNECFRSQFRRERDAPRSPIEITDWGLKHIDRLRVAQVTAREEKTRQLTGVWLPLLSTSVAIVLGLAGVWQAWQTLGAQAELKRFELELSPKQQAYARLMRNYVMLRDASGTLTDSSYQAISSDIESTFFQLEPFLADLDRTRIRESYAAFLSRVGTRRTDAVFMRDSFPAIADSAVEEMRSFLYSALFRGEKVPGR